MAASLSSASPPALKNGVDFQLQSAFAEENWIKALRLAERQFKSSGDAYYEILKVCIESKTDGMAERSAAATAVDSLVRNGTTPKDIEAIELLEWACAETQLMPPQAAYSTDATTMFSMTFGTLLLRWARANPRKTNECMTCLHNCLLNWDLVNAQQIATVLDKSSNTNDRRFMYWSVLLTHILSTSPQCPPAKQKIYGMLAQKQLEKAAELAEVNGITVAADEQPDRTLRDEEEFLLYFHVLATHGTKENYQKRALHLLAGAAQQFVTLGRKQVLLEVLAELESTAAWDALFSLCQCALGDASEGSSYPSPLACDMRIWRPFIAAAQRQADLEKYAAISRLRKLLAFDKVQQLLNRFITANPKLAPLYARNINLCLLQAVFGLPPSLLPDATPTDTTDTTPTSPRVEQLLVYIDSYVEKSFVFGDVKRFVEQLTFAEARDLLYRLAAGEEYVTADTAPPASHNIMKKVLVFKLRYLVVSNPAVSMWPKFVLSCTERTLQSSTPDASNDLFVPACKFCGQLAAADQRVRGCVACLVALATRCLQLHSWLTADRDGFAKTVLPQLDKDPRADLTLIAVSCLVRLAGLPEVGKRQLSRIWNPAHLLQAILLVDAQQRLSPDDSGLRLLLLRLYVRLGCCMPAEIVDRLWQPLDVKRTIIDALSPLFFDRLSTVAPGLLAGPKLLLKPLHTYFNGSSLGHPSAIRIWEAFTAGNYSSILRMAAFHERLQRSCTRAMAVVEERRTARAFGAKLESIEDVAMLADVNHNTPLVKNTDFGSMPNLENSASANLGEILALGPDLSSTRMHLGLLTERFLDLINFKPAKEYRPAKPLEAATADRLFVLEELDVVQSALQDHLHAPGAQTHLTASEFAYFTVVSGLAALSVLALSTAWAGPAPHDFLEFLPQTITEMLQVMRNSSTQFCAALGSESAEATTTTAVLSNFANLHEVAMLREAAMATKQTTAFLLAFHERETARDRTSKTGLAKDVLASVRAFQKEATEALVEVKGHFRALKETLGQPGWLDRISDTVTAGDRKAAVTDDQLTQLSRTIADVVGGGATVEGWATQLLEGWRETIKGWEKVQLE